jgi:hypothetical protein
MTYSVSREDRIRTCDPYVPNVVRYRAALLPEKFQPSGHPANSPKTGRKDNHPSPSEQIHPNNLIYPAFCTVSNARPSCSIRSDASMLSCDNKAAARSPANPCK